MTLETNKDDTAFRTIGELSKELNIKPHILRYWEDQFAMLSPLKRAGSRRHYRPEDVDMVKTINRLLNEEGYTIKGARKFLVSQKNRPTAPVIPADQNGGVAMPLSGPTSSSGSENSGFVLAELKTLRDRLAGVLERA